LYYICIALFIATSLPEPDVPKLGVSDKVEHFSEYCVLAFFLNLTLKFQDRYKWLKSKAADAAVLIASTYAALDELHQLLIPRVVIVTLKIGLQIH
jgi:VanZ family protein